MPDYNYKAINKNGTVEQGECTAVSIDSLHKELEIKGLFVEHISETSHRGSLISRRKRVTVQQLYLFVHEFISLLKAGMAIPEILQHLSNRPSQPLFSRILLEIRQKVVNGQTLSQSLDDYPDVFDRMFVNAVMIGEKNGQLVSSLNSYASYLKIRINIHQKVRSALVYPIFLSFILVLAVSVLFFYVMPRFTTMYAEFGAELPYPTQILINMVNLSHLILPFLILSTLVLIFAFRYWVVRKNGKFHLDKMWVELPWISSISIPSSVSYNASALATLLSVGMPMVEAVKAAAYSSGNRYIAKKLQDTAQCLMEGKGLADAMGSQNLMDDTSLTMIRAGEKSGELISALDEIASFNTEKLNHTIAHHLALVEPLIMLVMGLFIGGIIFVMYLPIFSIAEVIR